MDIKTTSSSGDRYIRLGSSSSGQEGSDFIVREQALGEHYKAMQSDRRVVTDSDTVLAPTIGSAMSSTNDLPPGTNEGEVVPIVALHSDFRDSQCNHLGERQEGKRGLA
jgi:hypothetical protein